MTKQALRGVNLGGWLVLEPWITPSLFRQGEPDEFAYSKTADDSRRARLKRHRETFITKKDFQWLAEHGVEAVRIPVGYWVFGDSPPYIGAIDYLDKAFDWARTYDIQVLVCLHGAPGSQNGEAHSGVKRQDDPQWHTDTKNIEQTLEIIERLASRYAERPNLLGIELLNEPSKSIPKRILRRYYHRAVRKVRYYCGPATWVVFNDGLNPQPLRWSWFMHAPFHYNVYQDTHLYQAHDPRDKALDLAGHLAKTRRQVSWLVAWNAWHRHQIVGEWSVALDAQSLTGLAGPARDEAYAQYAQAQLQAYERADAWFYWTYRTEDAGVWSFRQMIASNILRLP